MKVQLAWLTLAALLSTCFSAELGIAVNGDGIIGGDNSSSSLVINDGIDQHAGHVAVAACTDEVFNSSARFAKYGDDGSQFVECVSVGWGVLKSCDAGSSFDIATGLCVAATSPVLETTIASDVTGAPEITTEAPGSSRNSRFANFFGLGSDSGFGSGTGGSGSFGGWKSMIRGRTFSFANCTGNSQCVNGVSFY
jgi:hypothetical protein